MLLSQFDSVRAEGFEYYLVDDEDQITVLDIPSSFELMEIIPSGAEGYFWYFRYLRNQIPLFYGIELESFISPELRTKLEEAVISEQNSPTIRDYYHLFEKDNALFLVVDDTGTQDIRVIKFLPQIKESQSKDLEISELLSESFRSCGYSDDDYGFLLMSSDGEVVYEHNRDTTFPACSSTKVFTILWCMDAFREGLFTPETRIAYYEDLHFESGSGILQDCIKDGETRTVHELLQLINCASDNIAFHMLDTYRYNFAPQSATFYAADRFNLAVTPDENVLTPEDLYKAWEYLFNMKDDPYVSMYLDESRYSIDPQLFDQPLASHKPGLMGVNVVDAGIYWNDEGSGIPLLYAIMLNKDDCFVSLFDALAQVISEYAECLG